MDSECTQVRPPLLVQVATCRRVYVFVAPTVSGVQDHRLAQLLSSDSIQKVVFGNDEASSPPFLAHTPLHPLWALTPSDWVAFVHRCESFRIHFPQFFL